MKTKIPNSVIGVVSTVLAAHYYSHSNLDALFMSAGAPGSPPGGNCERKCMDWLRRCNEDPSSNALEVLGLVIQAFMDLEPSLVVYHNQLLQERKSRINDMLAKNQLTYQLNGLILQTGSSLTSKSLEDYFKTGDFSSIEKEFQRALEQLNTDPHASITAASSIIEAACKTYIETFNIEMPNKQSIKPLWKSVHGHLGLSNDSHLAQDQHKIIQGLSSIVDGVGSFRTHIGSAHGRGVDPPEIVRADARLAVNAANTVVIFIMERWHA